MSFELSDIEDLDEFGDQLTREHKSKSGGKRAADSKSDTARSSREQQLANAETQRMSSAKTLIKSDLGHFNRQQQIEYILWVAESLGSGHPVVVDMDKDFSYKATKGGGPGGQNRNKVSSAILCTHNLTGMFTKQSSERDQPQNLANAQSIILDRLERHIKNWAILTKKDKSEDHISKIVEEILPEEN